MKKTIFIILLSIVIAILAIALLISIFYIKFRFKNEKTNYETIHILDGPGMVREPKDLNMEEWRKEISVFYEENYGYKPDNVTCTEVGPHIIYVTIYHNTDLVAEYTLDAETGIASSPTERMANFFYGIFLDNLSTKVNFKNDECIAIGYIEKGKEAQIKEKYFDTDNEYESLTTVVEGDEYQFIVIPKSLDATLKIWKYNVSEDGELYFDELLLEAIGTPLLIKTQCTEVFPRVGVEYEFGDTKFTIPLMISGMDGKFTITDYKNLVKDISIY